MSSLRLRDIPAFWQEDKKLLYAAGVSFEPSVASVHPTEADLEALSAAYIASHTDDSSLFTLDSDSLAALVQQLAPKVASLWKEELTELPTLSLLSCDEYLAEFHRLNIELCTCLGIDVDEMQEILCPPSVALFPHEGRLLVADLCSLSAKSPQELMISRNLWKKRHLEYALTQALATTLYAQVRGDWKDSASLSLNPLTPTSQYILPALLLSTCAQLAQKSHPDWGLEVVHERVFSFYEDKDAFSVYKFVDLYLHTLGKSPAQLAMISDFRQPQREELAVVFTPRHPLHQMRVSYFKEGSNPVY